MNPRYKYGSAQDWKKWPRCAHSLEDINANQKLVSFYREKASHIGISQFSKIEKLIAQQVNQDFLNEISNLHELAYLNIEVLTADDLSPLCKLPKLKILRLYGIRKAKDFVPLLNIDNLESLLIENAKNLYSLKIFTNAHNLKALGIEGSMWTKQKIESLEPLAGLKSLEALFMSSVQLKDKKLNYLAKIPNLKFLNCARFSSKREFDELKELMPKLQCSWFDRYEI